MILLDGYLTDECVCAPRDRSCSDEFKAAAMRKHLKRYHSIRKERILYR